LHCSDVNEFTFALETIIKSQYDSAAIYSKSGLHAATEYDFAVVAYNNEGESEPAELNNVITAVMTTPGKVPLPSVTSATGGALVIAFEQPYDNGGAVIQGYLLEQAPSPAGIIKPMKIWGSPEGFVGADSVPTVLKITDLVEKTKYFFRARAINPGCPLNYCSNPNWQDSIMLETDFMSSPSAPSSPTVKYITRPSAVDHSLVRSTLCPEETTQTQCDITGGKISVTWTKPIDFGGYDSDGDGIPELTGYRIYARKRISQCNSPHLCGEPYKIVHESNTPDIMSATISGLTASTEYELHVRAMNPKALCYEVGLTYMRGLYDPVVYVSNALVQSTSPPTPPGKLSTAKEIV